MAKYEEWVNDADKLILIEGWARDGLTEEQISRNMGISLTTLKDWRKKYPSISAALKKGREVVDFEVESALYRRAMGYTAEEKSREYRVGDDGEMHLVAEKVNFKHVPPDTAAQIFWLKNRRSKEWRDKIVQAVEEEKEGTGVVMLPEVNENGK